MSQNLLQDSQNSQPLFEEEDTQVQEKPKSPTKDTSDQDTVILIEDEEETPVKEEKSKLLFSVFPQKNLKVCSEDLSFETEFEPLPKNKRRRVEVRVHSIVDLSDPTTEEEEELKPVSLSITPIVKTVPPSILDPLADLSKSLRKFSDVCYTDEDGSSCTTMTQEEIVELVKCRDVLFKNINEWIFRDEPYGVIQHDVSALIQSLRWGISSKEPSS